ncbi:Succinate-semialdehyde dehydrogenase (acetylating) [Linum grandiflorum]
MGLSRFLRNVIVDASKYISSKSNPRFLTTAAPSDASYHISSGGFMRGAVFWDSSRPISIEEFHIPRPKAGELLIKTKGCGVCHSDLHVIKGELSFPSPCAIGHEITGEVVEHGPMTDSKIIHRLPVGSNVIGAFIMPCGNCFYCSKGHDDLCEDFFAYNRAKGTLYDGQTRLFLRGSGKPIFMYSMGGLAEYCVVPAHALTTLPDTLPFTESAILGCAVFTAYGAMAHAAEVRPGDSVAVIGVGGVGSSCLQIARAFGASDIIAVDVQDDKLEKAKIFGATHTVNAAKEDPVEKIREITGGRGVDVAVEALGKPVTFSQCTRSVRDGGKAVMIGLAKAGSVGEMDINHLVRRKVCKIYRVLELNPTI